MAVLFQDPEFVKKLEPSSPLYISMERWKVIEGVEGSKPKTILLKGYVYVLEGPQP